MAPVASETGEIITLGGRWGKYVEDDSGFHWNIEAAMQTGDYQTHVTGTILRPNVWGAGGLQDFLHAGHRR